MRAFFSSACRLFQTILAFETEIWWIQTEQIESIRRFCVFTNNGEMKGSDIMMLSLRFVHRQATKVAPNSTKKKNKQNRARWRC